MRPTPLFLKGKHMNTLFDMPEPNVRPEDNHSGTGYTCGQCVSVRRVSYSHCDFLYCKKRPCNLSQFGIKKVKSRQPACRMFINAKDVEK